MDTSPKILESGTLFRSCEWIAFHIDPTLALSYEKQRPNNPKDYSSAIEKAALSLRAALFQGQIIATGLPHYSRLAKLCEDKAMTIEAGFAIPKTRQESIDAEIAALAAKEKRRIKIPNFPANAVFNLIRNEILFTNGEFRKFSDIKIDTEDLLKRFPQKIEKRGRKSLLSKEQIAQIIEYANSLNCPSQKQKAYQSKKWAEKNLGIYVAEETIRGFFKPGKSNG